MILKSNDSDFDRKSGRRHSYIGGEMKGRDNNHGTKSFNFEFILNTKLEKHYEKLVDDEMIFSKQPTNEKIYMDCRVISEDIVKIVATKLFGNSNFINESFNDNLTKIRCKIPEEIKDCLYNIKFNGNLYGHPNSKPYDATVEEVFRDVHLCLLWYFKSIERGIDEKYDVDFVIPNHKITGENEERYLKIIEQQKKEFEEKLEKANKKIEEIEKNAKEWGKIVIDKSKKLKEVENDVKESKKIISELNKIIEDSKNDNNTILNSEESKNFNKRLKEHEEELRNSRYEIDLLNETILELTKSNATIESNNFINDKEFNKIKALRESISEELKDVTKKINITSKEIKSFTEFDNFMNDVNRVLSI